MAFQFFTNAKIEAIDIRKIPESFKGYYESLPEQRKKEINELRPDLIAALFPSKAPSSQIPSAEITENAFADSLIEQWESMPASAWNSDRIDTKIVVCKVIPNGLKNCRIHRRPLQTKQLSIRLNDGSKYSVVGKFCESCFDFFVEEDKAEGVAKILSEKKIPALIQPLSMTLEEWASAVVPLEMNENDPIYIPYTWVETSPTCPVHKTELIPDRYRRHYKDREVIFDAWSCNKCQKVILRNADAQKLEDQCNEIGIPVVFQFIREEKKLAPVKKNTIPDWVVSNGRKVKSTLKEGDWPVLQEEDTVIIADSPVCHIEGHEDETEEVAAIIRVERKRAVDYNIKNYLLELGFCRICGKYYLDIDNFNTLSDEGRLQVTLIDDTGSFNSITSGDSFVKERRHLAQVEKDLYQEIKTIEKRGGYVGKYEVIHYYDEGGLRDAKKQSADDYKTIEKYDRLKPQPYRYRVDLTNGKRNRTYYIGAEDFDLSPESKVISFNSAQGKKLANVRTMEMPIEGEKWKVKLRRDFDISRAVLFGFLETSDKDAVFRAGITDPFLVKVLNTRKRQHQLVDIISTIQGNQNAIVDEPIGRNLIVQGCAGSGKTMVLLHRLSSLKYNYRNFDFSKVIILTPNANFNTHIQNLVSSLQIDNIARYSVEEYYRELLRRFDSSFAPKGRITEETTVNQAYVDYLYSTEFFASFKQAYVKKISSYRDLCDEINALLVRFGKKTISGFPDLGKDMIDTIINEKNALEDYINRLESDYREAKNSFQHAKERYIAVEKSIAETEQQLQNTISREVLNILAVLDRKKDESSNVIRNINERIEAEQRITAEDKKQYQTAQDALRETMANVQKMVAAELDDNIRLFEADLEDNRTALKDNGAKQLELSEIISGEVSQVQNTIQFECEEILDDLLIVEKTWLESIDSTDHELKEKENELDNLEKRLFVLNRATKIEKANSAISALQQDKKDMLDELEEIHHLMLTALNCEKPEECYALSRAVAPYLDEKTIVPECLLEQEYRINAERQRISFLEKQEQTLRESVRFYEESIHELQGLIRKSNKSITADMLPSFLKDASAFLKDPNDYLDLVRPLRSTVREYKKKIEESAELIKKLQTQVKESQIILDVFERVRDREYEEITVENYKTYLKDIVETLPETKVYFSRIQDQENRLRTEREDLPRLEGVCASAEKRLRQAEGARIDEVTLNAFNMIKAKTEKLNPKDIYQEVFSSLFDSKNDQVEERFRNAFRRTGGTHRFDLYLLIRFAMLFYGKTTGDAQIICIDEGQDITPSEYQMIQEVNGTRAVFNIFGDTRQLLKPNRGISDWQTVTEILRGSGKYVLNENYRNTNQITQYCNAYFHMDVQQTGADGREVQEIDRRFLEKHLSDFSSEENRCAVILPRAVNKDTYIDRNKLPENVRGVLGNGIGRGLIAVVYVDEVKGVEFDSVFVVPNGMTKNEKYIAFTRALSELTVVIDNDIPSLSDVILKEVVESGEKNKPEQQGLQTYEGIAVGKVVKRKKRSNIKTT